MTIHKRFLLLSIYMIIFLIVGHCDTEIDEAELAFYPLYNPLQGKLRAKSWTFQEERHCRGTVLFSFV